MKHLRFLFLTCLLPLTAAHAATRSVDFSALPETDSQALVKSIPSLKSDFFTLEHLDQAVRYLMGTGRYDRVEVLRQKNGPNKIFKFHYFQSRILAQIRVIGNQILSTEDITKLSGLSRGDYFGLQSTKTFEKALLDEYRSRGYFQTKLKVTITQMDEKQSRLDIEIEEGAPCLMKSLVVTTRNQKVKQLLEKEFASYQESILTSDRLALLEKSLNEVLTTHHYYGANVGKLDPTMNPQKSEAQLTVRLDEIYEFIPVFRGNHYFSTAELKKAVMGPEAAVMGLTLSPSLELAENIKEYYQSHGFANVEVKTALKVDEAESRKIMTFYIIENHRVQIDSIETSGRISHPGEFYDSFIRTHGSATLRRGYYVRSDFSEVLKELETDLRNQGHLQARVQSFRTEFIDRGRAVRIVLTVDEGPLTIIRRISYTHNRAFSNRQLEGLVKVKIDEPLRLKDLDESLSAIKQAYLDNGYLEVDVPDKDVVEYSRTGTQVSLNIRVHEGPQIFVNSIVIEGNQFTKDFVILNEISFGKGDILTPEKIEDSITRLQRMGIFSRVSIRTMEQQSTVAQRTIIISVTERDPGLLNFGMGFNTENDFTTRLYTGLSYRNINGTARVVSSRLELNSNIRTDQMEHKISIGFIEPYLLSNRTRGRINLVQAREVTKFDEATDLPFLHENTEIEFYLDHEYDKTLKVLWKIFGIGTTADYLRGQNPEVRNVARMGPTFELDYRDDLVNPSKGTLTRLTAEYSDPTIGSSPSVAYLKSTMSFTHYHALQRHKKWIWANSLRAGSLENHSREVDGGVPEIENFYLGGRQTIRGFAYDERFPSDAELGISTGEEYKLKTRSRFYLLKSELRTPINDLIGLSFFYDGGAVFIDGLDFADPYRDSIGAGVNIQTPVGPVNFEVGYKLDRRFGEEPFAIHLFSFGYF